MKLVIGIGIEKRIKYFIIKGHANRNYGKNPETRKNSSIKVILY